MRPQLVTWIAMKTAESSIRLTKRYIQQMSISTPTILTNITQVMVLLETVITLVPLAQITASSEQEWTCGSCAASLWWCYSSLSAMRWLCAARDGVRKQSPRGIFSTLELKHEKRQKKKKVLDLAKKTTSTTITFSSPRWVSIVELEVKVVIWSTKCHIERRHKKWHLRLYLKIMKVALSFKNQTINNNS